jgi:HTH-type transcriptional regulator/antitoxin HigA
MDIHPIRNDEDHAKALDLIERLWDAPEGSPEADKLDVLAILVDAYENVRWPIKALDPIDTIKEHMVATGRNQADLSGVIGSRSRASEVMSRKRPLTINMVRKLASEWHLPAELLIAPYSLKKDGRSKKAVKPPRQTKKTASRKPARKSRQSSVPLRRRVAAYA